VRGLNTISADEDNFTSVLHFALLYKFLPLNISKTGCKKWLVLSNGWQ